MGTKRSRPGSASTSDMQQRAAGLNRSLQPIARKLGLSVETLYADLRLHPRQWRANLGKVLALLRCVNLCNTRALWARHKPCLVERGHLNSLFAEQRRAAISACVLAQTLDPAHVSRRDAILLRALIKLLAEEFGGARWAHTWLRRPSPELGGSSPRCIAADAVGFGRAARVLATELKHRKRA